MPQTLEYEPVVKGRASSLLSWYFIYLAIFAVPVIQFFVVMCYWIPKFEEIFKDFRIVLPTMTSWLLWISYWVRLPQFGLPVLAVFLALPFLLAYFMSKIVSRARRVTAAMIVAMVLMFVSVSTFMLIETALYLPMAALIRSISGGAPGP